jgi:hypothetical protein
MQKSLYFTLNAQLLLFDLELELINIIIYKCGFEFKCQHSYPYCMRNIMHDCVLTQLSLDYSL